MVSCRKSFKILVVKLLQFVGGKKMTINPHKLYFLVAVVFVIAIDILGLLQDRPGDILWVPLNLVMISGAVALYLFLFFVCPRI